MLNMKSIWYKITENSKLLKAKILIFLYNKKSRILFLL
jgi:hypothetical protein